MPPSDDATALPSDRLPYDAVAHVRTDGVRLIDVVTDHGAHHRVPTCPEWDLGDLLWHTGRIWNRWATIVSEQLTTREEVEGLDVDERPADDELVLWVTAAHTALYSALVRARPDQRAWSFVGDCDVAWVRRRMVQETAMHRWDAANAVGQPYELPTAVAADGIDEYLMWFAGRRQAADAQPVAGTVHLHCTDTDLDIHEGSDDRSAAVGEWLVTRLDETGCDFSREHAKGDAAVRGRAHDLLMWVWRRQDSGVEILGDQGVAERFRAFPAL